MALFAGLMFIIDTLHYIVLKLLCGSIQNRDRLRPCMAPGQSFDSNLGPFYTACKIRVETLKLWAPVHSLMPVGSVHSWFRWSSEREELRMLLLTVLTNLITRCLACNLSNHISVEIDLYKTACSLIKGSWLEARRAYFWLIRSFEATNTRSLSRWRLAITLASGR